MRDKLRRDSVNVGPNEILRFFLELAALWAMALWGWTSFDGLLRVIVAIGVPLVAAAAWAIFRYPGDPNPAPVPVSGVARLALEFVFFGAAVVLLYLAGQPMLALVLAGLVIVHYVAGHRRVRRMIGGAAHE